MVHVHNEVHSIGSGEHRHNKTDKNSKAGQDGRTWSFSCTPECESQVIKASEFAAGHSGGVGFTRAEQLEAQDLEKRSHLEVGRLTAALAEIAKERVKSQ